MDAIHNAAGIFAILAGLIICKKDKGTGKHRLWGRFYILSMLLLGVTTFSTQGFQTGISAYKVFIIVSLLFIPAGIYPLIFRKHIKVWVVWHYTFMLYSFLFLMIGTVTLFIDDLRDFLMVFKIIESEANVVSRVLFWFLPFIVGTIWIFSKKRFYQIKFRNLMMRPPK